MLPEPGPVREMHFSPIYTSFYIKLTWIGKAYLYDYIIRLSLEIYDHEKCSCSYGRVYSTERIQRGDIDN